MFVLSVLTCRYACIVLLCVLLDLYSMDGCPEVLYSYEHVRCMYSIVGGVDSVHAQSNTVHRPIVLYGCEHACMFPYLWTFPLVVVCSCV